MANSFQPEIHIQENEVEEQEDLQQDKIPVYNKVEERKKRRIVKASHYLFNQQVLMKKPSKKKKDQQETDEQEEEANQNEADIRQFKYFSQNELDSYEEIEQKKKKKKWVNPLQVFKKHEKPRITDYENAPGRYDSRNIYELKFPRIVNLKTKDIRLEKELDPYLRQIIFDHNQVKKNVVNVQFDEKMKQYKEQFALYKQGLDELDEINRLAALNKYGAYPGQEIYIPPQFNLRSVKLYPPQLQAENMIRNYIPQSQIHNSNSYVNLHDHFDKQKKPRFLAPIPLTMKNVLNI
ncbi:hypothetical protein TTHERM_00486340 (macronuclear) [Tetrahymena thermophila SB210]|uniref:Uncharacterized protein n=1 Tax=Tetrahymena thermophila (strain SB210) TaxID=312017 RepID=I7M6G9_TETTS|nr:hypothetical protein TTHERM_00486340 [Tetrahymena thermophila SB210]EAR85183.1 hypothetical protein TTHERM_00486340 [Tetrahymena thermophila SB210]|eukprot:XP_001032846.1 hypothetical protein TTHERM_00486340 [Tetrahymena thermophila SB210]